MANHPLRPPAREEVYAALDGERAYQTAMTASPTRPDMVENLTIGDHILAMEQCLAEARTCWYSGAVPHHEALDYIRKVAGLGVRCMEVYGIVPRGGFNETHGSVLPSVQ